MYKQNKLILTIMLAFVMLASNNASSNNERKSKPSEIQSKNINKLTSNLPEMKSKVKKTRYNKFSRVNKMSNKAILINTQAIDSMPVVVSRNTQIQVGKDLQQPKRNQMQVIRSNHNNNANGESYLHLVLDVSTSGEVDVISAVNVPGKVNATDEALGDFIYKVSINNKAVLLQSVPDPFEMRAFPMPGDSGETGHHISLAKSTQMVIKVPNVGAMMDKLDSLKMDLYKLKPGYEVETINMRIFEQLKEDNRLKTILKIPSIKLAPQIEQKLKSIR